MRYLNLTKKEGYHWGMMRGVWSSVADLAVVQAQDVLGLGHESRMNTPSTLGGNWCWRAEPGVFNSRLARRLQLVQMARQGGPGLVQSGVGGIKGLRPGEHPVPHRQLQGLVLR